MAEHHPLVGRRVVAASFYRKSRVLMLVVELPDGTPGMIPAAMTDVFGEPPARVGPATVLTLEAVRSLRFTVTAIGAPKRRKSPKTRK